MAKSYRFASENQLLKSLFVQGASGPTTTGQRATWPQWPCSLMRQQNNPTPEGIATKHPCLALCQIEICLHSRRRPKCLTNKIAYTVYPCAKKSTPQAQPASDAAQKGLR